MNMGVVNNKRAEFILKRLGSSRAEAHFDGISGVEAFQKLRTSAQLRMTSEWVNQVGPDEFIQSGCYKRHEYPLKSCSFYRGTKLSVDTSKPGFHDATGAD